MNVIDLIKGLDYLGIVFFTGVPDSLLRPLCNYLMNTYGISDNHIIAANEGNAVAIAAGYHLATGNIPCVYLQNSGLGNIINPVASLLSDKVYGIPCVFIIGWRGEPGLYDEPQHKFQGEVTLKLLETMDIEYMILDMDTTIRDLEERVKEFYSILDSGKSVAFVVKKDGLNYDRNINYKNESKVLREDIIKVIVDFSSEDIIVSTTGKSSRELFEIREAKGQSHQYDFLTVGSMGHSSSIALSIALNKKDKRIWCIDGDGAALMHLGSMAIIGEKRPKNFVHVLINNSAHESVGGQPTVAGSIEFQGIAESCGYKYTYSLEDLETLRTILSEISKKEGPIFIEIKSAIGSRDDLGRPTITPLENKRDFMKNLMGENT